MEDESTESQAQLTPPPSHTANSLQESSNGAPQESANRSPQIPPLPNYLLDPRPIVLVGTLAWTVALLVHMLMHEVNMRTVILCAVGVGVGAVGTAVYALQRRAVIRGKAGAQQGLDFDRPAEDAANSGSASASASASATASSSAGTSTSAGARAGAGSDDSGSTASTNE